MKAIRVEKFGESGVLKLQDVDEQKPSADEILIDVKAVGVNPVDTYIRAGIHFKPDLPYTPGYDCAGIVKQTGKNISQFKKGDRVYTHDTLTGAYAAQTLCSEDHLHILPESVSFEQGAAIGVPYATAYRSLFNKAQAKPNESVLIHGGSGAVGLAAIQLAKSIGMKILATAGTKEGRDLVSQQGAEYVFDHYSKNYPDEIIKATDEKGVDIILEMLADKNLDKDLKMLAKGGRVVVIGCRGTVEINPRDTMSRELSIIGMTVRSASPKERNEIHGALIKGLEEKVLNPVIGQSFSLGDASKAHDLILEPGAKGKIVLIP